jgi:hypothetical protein
MKTSTRPNTVIIPAVPDGDRRPTLVRPYSTGSTVFGGWGPKL